MQKTQLFHFCAKSFTKRYLFCFKHLNNFWFFRKVRKTRGGSTLIYSFSHFWRFWRSFFHFFIFLIQKVSSKVLIYLFSPAAFLALIFFIPPFPFSGPSKMFIYLFKNHSYPAIAYLFIQNECDRMPYLFFCLFTVGGTQGIPHLFIQKEVPGLSY